MKYSFALITLLVTAFITGCSSTTPTLTQAQLVQLAETQVTPAVTAATAAILEKNPKYAPDVAVAATALNDLGGGTNVLSSAQLDALLASAGETNPIVSSLVVSEIASIQSDVTTIQGTNAPVIPAQYDVWLLDVATGLNNGLPVAQ